MRSYSSIISAPEKTLTGSGTGFVVEHGGAEIIRMNNAGTYEIAAIKAGYPGQEITFVSIGAGKVQFDHQQTSGTIAADRLINFLTTAGFFTELAPGVGNCTYKYDSVTARWRLINHNQGDYLSFTPVWSNFSTNPSIGNGSLTSSYLLKNREVEYIINATWGSTTTYGTGGVWFFTLPIPFSSATFSAGLIYMSGSGSYHTGLSTINTSLHANGDIVGILSNGLAVGDTNPGVAAADFYRMVITYGVS